MLNGFFPFQLSISNSKPKFLKIFFTFLDSSEESFLSLWLTIKYFTPILCLIEKTLVKKARARLSGPPDTATANLFLISKLLSNNLNRILILFELRGFFQRYFDRIVPYKKYYINRKFIPLDIEKQISEYDKLNF